MLAIDVGNTHITTGIFEGSELKRVLRTSTQSCLEECSFLPLAPEVRAALQDEVALVSVRKPLTEIILKEMKGLGAKPPLLVDIDTPMGIHVEYETKGTLGLDRLVAAAAAYHLYRKRHRPLIVIDMGTATTIDYVTAMGAFVGGMIAPGIRSAYEGLLAAAPQLPRLDELIPGDLIGTSTQACVRSGVVMGHAAMMRKVVEMAARSAGSSPVVVVTGGPSGMMRKALPKTYIVDENLILKGLHRIHALQG